MKTIVTKNSNKSMKAFSEFRPSGITLGDLPPGSQWSLITIKTQFRYHHFFLQIRKLALAKVKWPALG